MARPVSREFQKSTAFILLRVKKAEEKTKDKFCQFVFCYLYQKELDYAAQGGLLILKGPVNTMTPTSTWDPGVK